MTESRLLFRRMTWIRQLEVCRLPGHQCFAGSAGCFWPHSLLSRFIFEVGIDYHKCSVGDHLSHSMAVDLAS